jgi:hypothetical protein
LDTFAEAFVAPPGGGRLDFFVHFGTLAAPAFAPLAIATWSFDPCGTLR